MNDLSPTTILMQILCYPWLELKHELTCLFIENRHTIRSSLRILSIILATCVGLFIVINNPIVLEFFTRIISALEFVPSIFQTKAAMALSVLVSSSVGAYTSKAIIRSVCKCKFGDPDFFLTAKRKAELVQIFKDQEIDIQEDLIQQVVDFCIYNLRESHSSSEIGTTPQDWERILNSLIYDADLDLFLDQQAVLQTKHQRILDKQSALHTYKSTTINSSYTQPTEHQPEPLIFSPPSRASPPHNNSSSYQQASSSSEPPSTSPRQIDERTPLLQSKQMSSFSEFSVFSQPNRSFTLPPTSNTTKDFLLAQKVLAQFKHLHIKKHKLTSATSEEQLLHHCSKHLEHKAFCTYKCILDPNNKTGIDKSTKSNSPTSNHSNSNTSQQQTTDTLDVPFAHTPKSPIIKTPSP